MALDGQGITVADIIAIAAIPIWHTEDDVLCWGDNEELSPRCDIDEWRELIGEG